MNSWEWALNTCFGGQGSKVHNRWELFQDHCKKRSPWSQCFHSRPCQIFGRSGRQTPIARRSHIRRKTATTMITKCHHFPLWWPTNLGIARRQDQWIHLNYLLLVELPCWTVLLEAPISKKVQELHPFRNSKQMGFFEYKMDDPTHLNHSFISSSLYLVRCLQFGMSFTFKEIYFWICESCGNGNWECNFLGQRTFCQEDNSSGRHFARFLLNAAKRSLFFAHCIALHVL